MIIRLPIIRNMPPQPSISSDLVAVQPMAGPVGRLHFRFSWQHEDNVRGCWPRTIRHARWREKVAIYRAGLVWLPPLRFHGCWGPRIVRKLGERP